MVAQLPSETAAAATADRPDVFLSYAREDSDFVEGRLARALAERGKQVWIDVEDIRGGASDWRANVWAGIEAAKVVVFVLTPDSLASAVCGEELERAVELNKRIVPVLRRPVDGLPVPPSLERPNWIYARPADEFDRSVSALVDALELDEAWIDQHARFTQRTSEWLREDRDASYLLRGSDLRAAERWLEDQHAHREAPTPDQVAYITAGLRESARRQRRLLAGVAVALVATTTLAVLAFLAQKRAEDRERTARAQASAAQATAALSRDPEQSLRLALDAVQIRSDQPEAEDALRRSVAAAGWQSILRTGAAQVNDVEFSDDGLRAASAGDDGKVAVWDTRTGRRLALVEHGEPVHTVQFSPDGRQLLTAAQEPAARVWDSETGRLLHALDTRSPYVWAATYGGTRIATASAAGAQIWDAASGSEIARLPMGDDNYRGTIRLSLDGRHALTPGAGGDTWLWSVSPRRRVATLAGRGDPLRFALFSRDGRRILTVDSGGRAMVWATADGRPIARLPRQSATKDADISSDGRLVVTADGSGRARVWDVRSRRPITLRNGVPLRSALFDRAGRYVVTGDSSGVARVWSAATGRPVSVLNGHTATITRARFSPDGTLVATASVDASTRLWRALPRTPVAPRWSHADSTSFGRDSRHVLVFAGMRAAVWDTQTGSTVPLTGGMYANADDRATWPCGHAAGCNPWSPDGRLVAGADASGRAVVWDTRTGAARRLGRPSGSVIGAAFTADGEHVAVVDGARRRARIWDAGTWQPEAVVPGEAVGDVLVSAQFAAERVLTVDFAGRARLSDPTTGSSTELAGATTPAAVATRADGRQSAIGTAGELRVFSADGRALEAAPAPGGTVNSVSYDRAGTTIATGGRDGTTSLWNARTLEHTRLQAPGGQVTSATFSPDGRLVLVTYESVARLWDRRLGRVLLELATTRDASAEFSPDGQSIVLAGDDRLEIRRCYACMPLDALGRHARSLLPAP